MRTGCLLYRPQMMLAGLMWCDGNTLILTTLPFKVLIGCSIGIYPRSWKGLEVFVGLERTSTDENFHLARRPWAHPYQFLRNEWGVGISPLHTRCGRENETTINVLQDCVYANQVWIRLVLFFFITGFFTFWLQEQDLQ